MLELRTRGVTAPARALPESLATVRSTPQPRWPPEPDIDSPVRPGWKSTLALIEQHLPFSRRTVAAGCRVQRAGESFKWLHIINSGVAKLVNLAVDGRAQVVGLQFKGDWIGFDGIASGQCACDAVAMDTSEVWSVRYASVIDVALDIPALLQAVHVAMSSQLARDREWRLALGTLSSEARLADFICTWAASLAERQMRTDTISLRMTRVEIGTYLGMTHETVSRAFTRLERAGLLRFDLRGRRQLAIPDLGALMSFVRQAVSRPEAQPVHRAALVAVE